jgi:uncharacterized membrane-anchored protein YitT (DUF2179 family)
MTKAKLFSEIKSYLLITIGLAVFAFGWVGFLIPAKILGGGVSGVGALIFYATGLPVGVTYLGVNVFLVILAIKVLGASFGIKTIYGILLGSFFLWYFQLISGGAIVNEMFMSAILGGLLSGAGVAIAIASGGSTGGTDIIVLMINKYREVSPGRTMMYMDIVIIAISYLIFQSVEILVYSYVSMAVAAYAIDAVLEGQRQSYQIMIFSDNATEISERIVHNIGRGVTSFKGYGVFSKKERDVLIVIARKYDRPKIMEIIKETDKDAFVSVAKVMGVYGKGFERFRL